MKAATRLTRCMLPERNDLERSDQHFTPKLRANQIQFCEEEMWYLVQVCSFLAAVEATTCSSGGPADGRPTHTGLVFALRRQLHRACVLLHLLGNSDKSLL